MSCASKMTERLATQRRSSIFAILALLFIFVYFHRVSFAVVGSDLMSAFHISGTDLGVLAAGYFYIYAFMQLPAGLLVDSWGPKRTVVAFSFVAGIGAILFGLSPRFGMAIFARIMVGLGVSTVFVSSMKIFAYWFKGREYARVSGMFLAVGGLGWLIAATPLAVLSRSFGWRTVFIAIGLITLLLTVIAWSIIRDRPSQESAAPFGDARDQPGRWTMAKNVRQVLGERYFWPLAVWSFANGGILFGFFGLWAGPYLADTHGLPKTLVGNILAMVALAMIFGSPALGYLADRVVPSRKAMLLCSSIVHFFCWLMLVFCHRAIPWPVFYPLFFVMGITSCAIPVVLLTATRELFPGAIAGTAQGIMNLFPFAGSMVFQPALGFVLDTTRTEEGHYAYENAFWFLLIACVVGIGSLIFMKGTNQGGECTERQLLRETL